jgi:hypothetical protein
VLMSLELNSQAVWYGQLLCCFKEEREVSLCVSGRCGLSVKRTGQRLAFEKLEVIFGVMIPGWL